MAIKQKIPSPQDIRKTPQSFSEKELNEIKNLRNKIDQLSFQFGQIYIQKSKIEEQENTLKNELKSFDKKEAELAKKLTDKYGKGSIDLETGTFTPLA